MPRVFSNIQQSTAAGGLSITPDLWLSGIMSREVYRVSGAVDAEGETQAERSLRVMTERPGFGYARVPTHDLRTSHLLERQGFSIVDTGITLEVRKMTGGNGRGRARLAQAADQTAVEQIARRSFTYSRFHLDPQIPRGLADEIKAQWVGNYFRGQRGDYLVVAEQGGEVAGFLQLLKAEDDTLVIDLIAVVTEHREQGVAEEMIGYAAAVCGRPQVLRAGAQCANTGSLGFYQKLGFRIVSSSYVFHHHGSVR